MHILKKEERSKINHVISIWQNLKREKIKSKISRRNDKNSRIKIENSMKLKTENQ